MSYAPIHRDAGCATPSRLVPSVSAWWVGPLQSQGQTGFGRNRTASGSGRLIREDGWFLQCELCSVASPRLGSKRGSIPSWGVLETVVLRPHTFYGGAVPGRRYRKLKTKFPDVRLLCRTHRAGYISVTPSSSRSTVPAPHRRIAPARPNSGLEPRPCSPGFRAIAFNTSIASL
jgi:hypothetical protein